MEGKEWGALVLLLETTMATRLNRLFDEFELPQFLRTYLLENEKPRVNFLLGRVLTLKRIAGVFYSRISPYNPLCSFRVPPPVPPYLFWQLSSWCN